MPLIDKVGNAFEDGDTAPRCISVVTSAGAAPEEAPTDDLGGQVIDFPAFFDACIDKAQAIKNAGG